MANTQTQNPVREAFAKLPPAIQEWLASERVTEQIIRTNQQLSNFGKKSTVIPLLLARLVTKALDPRDFINELHKESGLSLIDAKLVTQELDQSILRPIRGQLKAAIDLDINLLYAWEPKSFSPTEPTAGKISAPEEKPIIATTPSPAPIPKPIEPLFRPAPIQPAPQKPSAPVTPRPEPPKNIAFAPKPAPSPKPLSDIKPSVAPATTINKPTPPPTPPAPSLTTKNEASPFLINLATPSATPIGHNEPAPPAPPVTPVSPRTMEESRSARPELVERAKPTTGHPAPFILHEEKSEVKPTLESTPPTKSSLSFKIPFTTKKEAPKITHPPINVSLETPFESEDKNKMASTKPQENRVVHYSDLRTPVDPFTGQNQK